MAQKPPSSSGSSSALKTGYLVLYNFVSATLWTAVLGRTVLLFLLRGAPFVYLGVGAFAKWTQTLAALEVLHSLAGLVRAPPATTLMQVSSRLLLVWPVVDAAPHLAASPWYAAMLTAWSVTEVVRYSYFALALAGALPPALTWVRYSLFYLLYPVGIASECVLVYRRAAAAQTSDVQRYFFYAVLAIYVPGSYILFTHMMKQRRKVMRSLKADGAKSQ
ncbi:protein tyrosine phosphatase [Moelleriella libera RCEF 2490]|uniref:Very-long-chain (3R)-3-hydroxyacyl-CoA dehydratase n=1 Tax=Moelleriella libera RCEF 2490 TaxID=1081109 RepID=A0A162IRW3_9HYPO|nr:protein tyrosine phosphatase [Moelleriella libera RCEF 2490]